MDIHGYIHVWISDLGSAVDISMDMRYQYLIGNIINSLVTSLICVCIEDADTLLLLRILYSFFLCLFLSYFTVSPKSALASLETSATELKL